MMKSRIRPSTSRFVACFTCFAVMLTACGSGSASSPQAQATIISEVTEAVPTTTRVEAPPTSDPVEDHQDQEPEPVGHDEDPNVDHHDDADGEGEGDTAGAAGDSTQVSGNADPADANVTISVELEGGSVIGGSQRHEVAVGDIVLIEVVLGEADELHLHGYDYVVEGSAGETVQIAFVADIPGIWELELEGQGIHLLELEVS